MGVAIVFGFFGLIIGSFFNVLIIRRGVRMVSGRSACMSCAKELAWYDLVPVLSWVVQRGHCRQCGSAISRQYVTVEVCTAAAFAVIGAAAISPLMTTLGLVAASLLILIAAYDARHTIIPDEWVYSFIVVAILVSFMGTLRIGGDEFLISALLAGPIAAAPLFCLWALSRGAWMGFGDIKLALGMGWLLGVWGGLSALLLAFVLGAVVSIAILIPMARYSMKSEVPFGPFLVVATFIVWGMQLYGLQLPFIMSI